MPNPKAVPAPPDFSWLPTRKTCDCASGLLNCLTRRELIKLGSTVIDQKHRERWSEPHGGRFIPQVPEKFIRLFSHPGETVLDPFCGSGTTNFVAKQLGRSSVGIDVNPYSVDLTLRRLSAEPDRNETRHVILQGNCLDELTHLPDDAIDLIVTSPPYLDVVDYRDQSLEQWGNLHDYSRFLHNMTVAFRQLRRVLKPGGYMVVVTQDVYKRAVKAPIHADYVLICRDLGLEVVSTQVYVLNYSTGGRLVYGYPRSYYPKNDHEFVVIVKKE